MKLDTLKIGDRFIANGSEYEFKKIVKHKGKEVASCIKIENDAPYLVMLSVEVELKEK